MTEAKIPNGSLITPEVKTEIHSFFDKYALAFSNYDLETISNLWSFPCLISSNEQSLPFFDKVEFTANLKKLCDFYKSVGMEKAQKVVLDIQPMTSNSVSAKTRDTAFNKDGDAIVSWEQAYVLHFEGGEWKALTTLADGEVTTWAAKGTPLAARPASSDNLYLD